jgi:hypothetical protein
MVAKTNLTAVTDQVAEIDKRVVVLETEIHIQFKDLYNRIKRIEAWAVGSATSIILLLLAILYRM